MASDRDHNELIAQMAQITSAAPDEVSLHQPSSMVLPSAPISPLTDWQRSLRSFSKQTGISRLPSKTSTPQPPPMTPSQTLITQRMVSQTYPITQAPMATEVQLGGL